jgi:hypothetical protein
VDSRSRALVEARRRLLALSPADRVSAMLAAPRPADLVRALPAQELFLSLAEVGPDDALPLLAHASIPQLEFFFDIDAWSRDRFEPERAAHWISMFHDAGPEVVAHWLREADEGLVVLVLSRLLRVYKNDESTDQPFWPPDRPVPTLDGLYYFEPQDEASEPAAAVLWEALARLRARDRGAYEALLEQVLWAIPAELEEGAHEHRASRLAEKGFPDPEEALGVWSVEPGGTAAVRAELAARVDGSRGLDPAPGMPAGALPAPPAAQAPDVSGLPGHPARVPTSRGGEPVPPAESGDPGGSAARGGDPGLPVPFDDRAWPALATAARGLDDDRRERLLGDVVRLANRFAVAAFEPLGDPETHRRALYTAMSTVSLGLDVLGAGRPRSWGTRALAALSVFDVSRAGVTAIQERALRARRLAGGWLSRIRLGRERLDTVLAEALEGLLQPRPSFTIAGEDRSFRSPADLGMADRLLATIEALGGFLQPLAGPDGEIPGLDPPPLFREAAGDVEWSAVVLTALARAALGGAARPVPLDREEARRACDLLLDAGAPRRKSLLFDELARNSGLAPAADYLAGILEQDLADLPPGVAPDPRFARALLFRAAGP